MIASQKIGKSFMGALGYNLDKMNRRDIRQRAELLDTNFSSLNRKAIKKEVELLRQLRPNLKKYVYHTSLNFSVEELQLLSNEKLLAIAHDYLIANGFTGNQYLIFRHHDAGHPHLHLLVNRIRFDGIVVSDSNNYKKSEAIVRDIEKRYDLIRVESSNKAAQKPAKKDELEMVMRTGKPSDKMILQQLMKKLLNENYESLTDLIKAAEENGIRFLFNQQTTGRISGITYFYKSFKVKGQGLGNRFKWSEISKSVNYEKIRDRQTVSEANSRTRAIYGANSAEHQPTSKEMYKRPVNYRRFSLDTGLTQPESREKIIAAKTGTAVESAKKESQEVNSYADLSNDDHINHSFYPIGLPQIADDVDDEAMHGKKRRRYQGNEGMSR